MLGAFSSTYKESIAMQYDLHVTEHKSLGKVCEHVVVRVFVDDNYDYGLFIPEPDLFVLLTPEQQQNYLTSEEGRFKVSKAVAQAIIDQGRTPYSKQQLR